MAIGNWRYFLFQTCVNGALADVGLTAVVPCSCNLQQLAVKSMEKTWEKAWEETWEEERRIFEKPSINSRMKDKKRILNVNSYEGLCLYSNR